MDYDAKNCYRLADLAKIMPGYPIRSAIKAIPGGVTAVVQIRNANPAEGVDWPSVARTKLTGKKKPDWLQAGDILFAARGNRNFAVCLDEPPLDAVCAPQFFLIRLKDQEVVLPEFIAWQMNQDACQRYFAQSATGSYITSIRRKVLEEMCVPLPSVSKQKTIVRLSRACRRESELLSELIELRRKELAIVASDIG